MKKIHLTRGFIAIVDDEDYERLIKYKWQYCPSHNKKIYAKRGSLKGEFSERRTIYMHKQILNHTNSSEQIDHINNNGLDNRKENLRICKPKENCRNRSKGKSIKTSSFKGVFFRKERKTWTASIRVDNKLIYLGSSYSEVEAAKIYNAGAIKYFGKFAKLNEF